MHYWVTAAVAICALAAHARLDYIDADGVTERGGTADAARMLPRTGPDGRLDASLMPASGSWELPPMPRIYFVDAHASAEGDGSARRPFKTLTAAAAAVPYNAALFLAPGVYDGTITLSAGRVLTLTGCGYYSRLNNVTVNVTADNENTTLMLNCVSAATLTVNGESLFLRASDVSFDTLAGNSTKVKFRRYGMGTRVTNMVLTPLNNNYIGYNTAPYAEFLKLSSSPYPVFGIVDNRPTISWASERQQCAYLTDIWGATNAVYGTVAELRQADERLSRNITAVSNSTVQMCGAISRDVGSATNTMNVKIGEIATKWDVQATGIVGRVDTVSTQLSALDARERTDVSTLKAADAQIKAAYAAADSALRTELRGELSEAVSDLTSDTIPTISMNTASAVVDGARSSIVEAGADRANAKYLGTINGRIDSLNSSITTLNTAIGNINQEIINIWAEIRRLHPNQ